MNEGGRIGSQGSEEGELVAGNPAGHHPIHAPPRKLEAAGNSGARRRGEELPLSMDPSSERKGCRRRIETEQEDDLYNSGEILVLRHRHRHRHRHRYRH
ncbi:hypothetical protein NL676_033449 [Syzygium grande]|nr:hypothetical protein NL676_033449 [Syzygium grande]